MVVERDSFGESRMEAGHSEIAGSDVLRPPEAGGAG